MLDNNKSYLFVPGTSERFINKAFLSKADVIILDLEDSVGENDKAEARRIIKNVIQNKSDLEKKFIIRINDLSTDFWIEDLNLAISIKSSGIMIPKAESKNQIEQVIKKVSAFGVDTMEIFPLIETAKGLFNAYEMATSHEWVTRLAFGSVDYTLDLGIEPSLDGKELLYARSMLVNVSRAAEILSPIDSPYIEILDEQGFLNEVTLSKQLGFKSKLLLHPKQIDLLQAIYRPSQEEIEEAQGIVKEFEKALQQKKAAISHNGRMIDYPVYKKAKLLVNEI